MKKPRNKSVKSIFTPEYSEVIEKLINARKKADLTQLQVAEKLGWRQDYISKLENRQRRLDIIELSRLAKIYKKPLSYFTKGLQ
jgi:transcriptional regulator with XRE-family HTH domain